MYKLNEQPVARIFDEMVDFCPLCDRVAVCKVKVPFSIYNINYEVDDLVALSGDTGAEIIVEYYQDFIKKSSADIQYGVSSVSGNSLRITVDDFKKSFELCEEETVKVEKIIKQARNIQDEKDCEIEKRHAEPMDDYVMYTIIIAVIIAFVMMLALLSHNYEEKIIVIICSSILFALDLTFFLCNLITQIKRVIIEKKYFDNLGELDEQRKLEGMYISESEESSVSR